MSSCKKFKIAILSGWGQNPNSLFDFSSEISLLSKEYIFKLPPANNILNVNNVPDNVSKIILNNPTNYPLNNAKIEYIHLNYLDFPNIEKFLSSFQEKLTVDLIISWSLGSCLAIELLSKKIIFSKSNIFISTPFQFISSNEFKFGMDEAIFEGFFKIFLNNHKLGLKKFNKLIFHSNNVSASQTEDYFNKYTVKFYNVENLAYWLSWLKKFSCFFIDFDNIQNIMFIFGKKDIIVNCKSHILFQNKITNSKYLFIEDASHAPHITNIKDIKLAMQQKINLY